MRKAGFIACKRETINTLQHFGWRTAEDNIKVYRWLRCELD
jgi:hypothetical protein